MKIKIFNLCFVIIVSILIFSCSSSKNTENEGIESIKKDTIATIGDEVITLKEYEDFYIKNNGGYSAIKKATDESKKQFLDLLIKYRLKVKDAYKNNYNKDPEILSEISEYEKSLAVPYVIEKEVTEPNLKVWYERRKSNLKISAILIRTDWNSPKDTIEKYNLIKSFYDSLNAGKSFKYLAANYSELQNTKSDSGNLGYVTAGQTVPNFEEAIYSLKIGEYSKNPIKLRPGYIIPMVTDIEPRSGGRNFAHILFQYKQFTKEDSLNLEQKADSVYNELLKGANFEDMVKKFSDDLDSRDKGGIIGTFERDPNLEPKDFWNEVFKLKLGEYSKPIKTWFGIHIVKLVGIEPYPSFNEAKDKLKEEYQALKYNSDYQNFIASLKRKYNFTTNLDPLNEFYNKIDTNKAVYTKSWDSLITLDIRNKVLFSFANQNVIVDSVIEMINRMPEFRDVVLTPNQFKTTIDRLTENLLLQYKASLIHQEHPEFKKVMKEYVDGILLYKAEQEAVWKKLSLNDSAMRAYFEEHKDDFKFQRRVEISEIWVKSDSLSKEIHKMLTDTLDSKKAKGKKSKKIDKKLQRPTFEELAEKYTEREGYKEKKGLWKPLSEYDNVLATLAFELGVGGLSAPRPFEGGYSIIKVNRFIDPCNKTYEEALSELSSKFQEYETKRLEGLWLDSLKTIFPVKKFDEKLKEAFKNYK